MQVHFKVSAAWYCSHYLPPWSLTPVANLPPVSTTQGKMVAKFAAGVFDTGGNLPPVSLTPGRRCRWYRWCTLACEYLREFSKKFKTVLMWYSGAGGKLIHEKTGSKKSRDTVALSRHFVLIRTTSRCTEAASLVLTCRCSEPQVLRPQPQLRFF